MDTEQPAVCTAAGLRSHAFPSKHRAKRLSPLCKRGAVLAAASLWKRIRSRVKALFELELVFNEGIDF